MTTDAPLDAVKARVRLGTELVSRGLIEESQLEEALEEQRGSGLRLGRMLVTMGLISEVVLVSVLADHFGIGFVDLDDRPIDVGAGRVIRESFARRHCVLGMGWDGDVLLVAMENPSDVFALDDLRTLAGAEVRPFMAEGGQIKRAIDLLWRHGSDAESTLTEASQQADRDAVPARQATVSLSDVEQSPVVRFVAQLISRAVNEGASDVHMEPTASELRVRFRVDGMLRDVMRVPANLQAQVVSRIKIMAEIDIADRRAPQDGRCSVLVNGRPVDLRIVSFPTTNGDALVLRLLDKSGGLQDIRELGFLSDTLGVYEMCFRKPSGAVIVTGPTGSGKSTTLYATLAEINEPHRNIITVEDPVEYAVPGVKQVQVNRRAGLTFASVLRSILRADPDVVLVGEIRDQETARIAVEAALTGHLVLSSLHTKMAAAAPARLIDMGVEPFLVTSAIECVVGQRLARRLCDRCRLPYEADERDLARLGIPTDTIDGPITLHRASGCGSCGGSGYRGRFAIHEVMPLTEEISRLVMDRATAFEVQQAAVEQGMITMRHDGLRKVLAGLTSPEELARVVA